MSDRLYGGVRAGAVSVSLPILLRGTVDGLGATGKLAANVAASYWRQGGSRVAITLADLTLLTDAYSSGGFKEVDATNQKGLYRLDPPDAAFAVGADWVVVTVQGTGLYEYHERFALESRRSLRKGMAFAGYTFVMRQTSNPGIGATGLTVTAERSLNGGAFAACANAVAEIASGAYTLDLATTDVAGEIVTFKFTATGALPTFATHILEPG